jgi:hypothetical protein
LFRNVLYKTLALDENACIECKTIFNESTFCMDRLCVKFRVTHLTSHRKPMVFILLYAIVQNNIIRHFNVGCH